ncbi:hypothetical protein F4775DRAFT_568938 [Biscogniauxia sp. FL1348]|nr:hypothetical protein F4775DRAFT_568938 [Biscogniauxia sp. FL1348]
MNQSLVALGKPGHMRVYYGSVAFCCYKTDRERCDWGKNDWIDATLGDFRDVIDSLVDDVTNSCIVDPKRFPLDYYDDADDGVKLWPAVKLNCEGDIKRFFPFCQEKGGLPLAEEVSVLSLEDDELRLPCHLPQLAGLPWVMQPCAANNATLSDKELQNYGARVFAPPPIDLRMDDVPLSQNLPTMYCGSIIVLHEKGQPIYHPYVMCFFDFVEVQLRQAAMKLSPALEPGMHRVMMTLGQVESRITKERFLEYWTHWVEDKPGVMKHLIRSPYDTAAVQADMKILGKALVNFETLDNEERDQALADARRDLGIS